MKKLFIGILLLAMPSMAAASLDYQDLAEFNGLDETQKAAIVSQLAQFQAQNTSPVSPSKLKEYTEWVDFGTALGRGLASTAAEVGVAADELINTTTGKIAVVLIAYQIVGKDLFSYAVGLFLWVTISAILIWSYRRMCLGRIIKPWPWQKYEPKLIEPAYEKHTADHGTAAFLHAVMFVILNVTAIATLINL